jgi:hypothetical protein
VFFGFAASHGYTVDKQKKFEMELKMMPKEKRKFELQLIDEEVWCIGVKTKA